MNTNGYVVQLEFARDIDHWRMVKEIAPQFGLNDGVVRILGRIFSGQAIPADKARVIILNTRNFKTRASRDAPIGIL